MFCRYAAARAFRSNASQLSASVTTSCTHSTLRCQTPPGIAGGSDGVVGGGGSRRRRRVDGAELVVLEPVPADVQRPAQDGLAAEAVVLRQLPLARRVLRRRAVRVLGADARARVQRPGGLLRRGRSSPTAAAPSGAELDVGGVGGLAALAFGGGRGVDRLLDGRRDGSTRSGTRLVVVAEGEALLLGESAFRRASRRAASLLNFAESSAAARACPSSPRTRATRRLARAGVGVGRRASASAARATAS